MMYGLLGSPVGKSWSEVLFNRIFELEENNNIYTAINVSPVTLKRLMEKMDVSFQGFNVTIPYKEDILRYTENRDPLVWKAGVSNVIKREGNGFTAFNTDYAGIEELFTKNGVRVDGKRVAIAGAGGVARIMIYYILTNFSPDTMHIFTRNPEITRKKIKGTWQYGNMKIRSYDDMEKYDVLINCTPLGMNEDDQSPFSPYFYDEKATAIDLTYQYDETKFMKYAAESGGRAINGRDMFFRQAEETYRIFFTDECEREIFSRARGDTLKWMTKRLS